MSGHSTPPQPGRALRDVRKHNGRTLAGLSRRTGLAICTISKIANGRVALTKRQGVAPVRDLGAGLRSAVQRAFARAERVVEASYGRRCIVRAGEGEIVDTKNSSLMLPQTCSTRASFR
jgi:transcriptional regulator with XRE-family HTH domain